MTVVLKKKIRLSLVAVLLALLTVTALAVFNRRSPPPAINGTLIPVAKPLGEFSLLDHNNRAFTHQDLLGQWHLVSYGYTFCPDICPMTLTTLAKVAHLIEQDQEFTDVGFLFYTIDPKRDTPERLAEYVTWFDPHFIGLTAPQATGNPDLAFERSLGMVSILTPIENKAGLEDVDGYTVAHGVMIYLLNPKGDLQAIFRPSVDAGGTQFFTSDQIYKDYRAIRNYLG